MRRSFIWLLLYFGCFFCSCVGAVAAEPSKDAGGLSDAAFQSYADNVIAFERSYYAISPVSAYGYIGMESFERIADASVENPALCVRFLSEKKYTENQRRVSLLAMYKLSVDQYVAFVRDLVKLRDNGLISPEELKRGLYPRLSVDTVYEHYQDAGVRLLLTEIEARDDISPSDKDEIRRILSGEALEERRRFDRECCSVFH
ncbi:hypothetical protein JQ604_30795 [Bradyrhizobium jicamae]|uniref:hypothetical protein n=1 Tax=Bradyrhizobium jicamae TaxID=280332 RepID=UPI001BA9FDFD|nr:hypothetical protein [Bradyrhizobium jicamae]MBR0756588.1 hypothetical protein [Bradyrhizobium jicamae]